MRATLERTGGFAGIRLNTSVDDATLDSGNVKRLHQLVKQADFFHLPEIIAPSSPQPDRFQYKVTIVDGVHKHTVTVSETAIPSSLKPLVDWLMQQKRGQ